MKIEMNNFYIITGGPGSGKTSIIDGIKKQGFITVDEVARQIIKEQLKIDGDALHTQNQRKFLDLMLSRSIFTYEQVIEREHPVFFDRGIPELIGYCRLVNIEVPSYLNNATKLYHYNKNVFITPPWKEIYQHDEERKQTWQEAIDTYQQVMDSYIEAGYQLIEIPRGTIAERVNFILKHKDP